MILLKKRISADQKQIAMNLITEVIAELDAQEEEEFQEIIREITIA